MINSVSIPPPLRNLTEYKAIVYIEGNTIGELIDNLEKAHVGIRERLLDSNGNIRRFINIYVNGEDIRFLQDKETPLKQNDEVLIIPAMAGG